MHKIVREESRIVIPSSLDYLRDVDEFVEEKLSQKRIHPSLVADIAISVTEVVINAVNHGNKADPDKTVSITVQIGKEEVTVRIEDQGEGFDPQKVRNPLDEENLLREAGRGIFIVRSLMDEVKIESGQQGGTMVTMVKKF